MPTEKRTGGFLDPIEVVERFRADIETWFVRYQNFYDRTNASMRNYRMAHVALIAQIYERLMTVFGDDLEAVRISSLELVELIESRRGTLGENNECLNGVAAELETNSVQVSSTISMCAIYANQTLSRLLVTNFYPAFANIQQSVSTVPNAVIDALSRGNVFQEEEEIIEFLRAGYEVIDMQWMTAVSQLMRWETNRFEVDGLFLIDEMTICMANQVLDYILTNVRLEGEALACS